jgi:hypothetical protein
MKKRTPFFCPANCPLCLPRLAMGKDRTDAKKDFILVLFSVQKPDLGAFF